MTTVTERAGQSALRGRLLETGRNSAPPEVQSRRGADQPHGSGPSVPLFLAAALKAVARGWWVFPTRPDDKAPATRNGLDDATDTEDGARELWARHPTGNIAVVTGPSGLTVLDLDQKPGPDPRVCGPNGALNLMERALHEWGPAMTGQVVQDIEATFVVGTPRGGMHAYFGPSDLSPSAGRVAPLVDVRSGRSYTVLFGTVNGVRYTYEGTADGIQPCPDWLLSLGQPPPPSLAKPGRERDVDWSPNGLVRFVEEAHEGARNDRLNWAAWTMRQDGESLGDALSVLVPAARIAGLTDPETNRTVRSAYRGA